MRKVGSLIERLKNGEVVATKHENPYLQEAMGYAGILLTPVELFPAFPKVFSEDGRPIVLEIGSYLGKNLVEMATEVPSINVLGLEITYKRAVKTARKIQRAQLQNAKISICDARHFLPEIPNETLSGVCVFFPDPWPKARHEKNKLVRKEFFEILKTKIVPGGFVWFKTDHEAYFNYAIAAANECGWGISKRDVQPEVLRSSPYITIFEAMFLTRNEPVYRVVFSRPSLVEV
jgi:tRNA (guanine-N7-)-methyltransferase